MYDIKSRRLRLQILTFTFLVLLKKKLLKSNLQKKMIVEEELDCIDIADIGT